MRFERYNYQPIKTFLSKITFESDLLVYHSTFPDCKSWAKLIDKEPKEGTIFIKALCNVLSEAYRMLPINLALSQMITKINKYQFVFGSRYVKNASSDDDTIITFIGNKIFTFLSKKLLKIKLISLF